MSNYDVVIAGYGPTGAVAANLLGAKGHRVLVVEPALTVYDIPRAVHFDGEVMRIFQALGLGEEIHNMAAPGKMIKFVNDRGWTLFQQDLSVVKRQHGWFNNLFFAQPRLETCLRAALENLPNIDVMLGWKVSGVDTHGTDKGTVDLQVTSMTGKNSDSQRITAGYLLACDGANSPVRKMLKMEQEDLDCDEPWLVCDLELEEGAQFNRTAIQICDPSRPASLIPCENNHIRWEFMLNKSDEVSYMEDENNVRSLMSGHLHHLSPDLKSTDGKLIRAKVYTFHALIAKNFQLDRVFLLGDAAHQMPPFLGQGMCAGMRDAYNLSWKLSGVLNGDYSPKLLTTYNTERRVHVRKTVETAVAHGAIIQTKFWPKAFIRDTYLMLGRVFPWLVRFLKFGEGVPLGNGLLMTDPEGKPTKPVGEPLPQSWVTSTTNASASPIRSDDLLTEKFTVIGFGIDPLSIMAELSDYDWLDTLHFGSGGSVQETDGEIMNWVAENNVAVAILRPDRQVYGICKSASCAGAELPAMIATLIKQLH
jgi:3-(3-hydroxy-phenyl)propionate hydroxylase